MSEKDEVLKQISEIKSHLIDKESFFPYNYKACHVWSVISVILTLLLLPAYSHSIMVGTIVTTVFIIIGFVVEGVLTKKENEQYDIDDCTKKQQFIMRNFIMISLFTIVFSVLLALANLYVAIFLLWLVMISFGHFAVGFVLNIKYFEQMARFNIFVALVLLIIGISFEMLDNSNPTFTILVQAMVIFGLAIIPSVIANKKLKEQGGGCSV